MPAILQESSVNSLAVHPENTAENFTTGLYPPVSRLQPPFRIRFRARNHPIIIFSPSKRRAENLKIQKDPVQGFPGIFSGQKTWTELLHPSAVCLRRLFQISGFIDKNPYRSNTFLCSFYLFSPISFQWILLHHTETMIWHWQKEKAFRLQFHFSICIEQN